MSYPEIMLAGTMALNLVLLPGTFALSLIIRKRQMDLGGQPICLSDDDLDRIAGLLGQRLGLNEETTLGSLSSRIEEMRRDFDWLVSDRMIEQAIDMARSGESGDAIGRSTGISEDELYAIRKFRRH